MQKVKKQAIREFINDVLDTHIAIEPNNVVDPSAAVTDPLHSNTFTPQSKVELEVAFGNELKHVPVDLVPKIYDNLKSMIKNLTADQEEETMKDQNSKNIEETLRKRVRNMLQEMGVGKSTKAYKTSALGTMSDVEGASFEEIAKTLNFSVAGAKQAVDKALEKARFIATQMEPEDLDILALSAMNDYIKMLNKSGELTSADVQLMKDHPDIVRELDGFREFLHNYIRKARKAVERGESPVEESAKKKLNRH